MPGSLVEPMGRLFQSEFDYVARRVNRFRYNYMPFIDIGGISRTILIAGSGRSGTTWVGDVIAQLTHTRPMFEPFLLTENREFAFAQGSHSSRHVDSISIIYGASGSLLPNRQHHALERILAGRVRAAWIDRAARPTIYRGRTIKEIRANLLLGYITQHWPELKAIWLVRNAYDVIDSQLAKRSIGWRFECNIDHLLEQSLFSRDWLTKINKAWLKETTKTVVERLTHRWCLENIVPIMQRITERSNVIRIDYKDLLTSKESWDRVARHISSRDWNPMRLKAILDRPSHTSRSSSERHRTDTSKWPYLSAETLKKISNILDAYESLYNVELVRPEDRQSR